MNQHSPAIPPLDQDGLDLIIKHATVGLDDDEQARFKAIANTHADEVEQIELTVAAFDIAVMNRLASLDGGDADVHEDSFQEESLPSSLRSSLDSDADSFFQNQADQEHEETVQRSLRLKDNAAGPPVTRREIVAMAIAAASLLLVFSGYNPLTFNPNANTNPSNAQKLSAFLSSKPDDLTEATFEPVMNPTAGGKVYWSQSKQEGFMVLTGLNANDPAKEQYQLWIFDTDPRQEIPVDGGVFDFDLAKVNGKGEVIVPFRAHVPVDKAVMFAVTGERSGGVMRSDRSNLPLLAKLN